MDDARALLCVLCVILLNDRAPLLASPMCDQAPEGGHQEGNIGETGHFPWLGVLRVHLHHGDSMKIALTGLVLVKERYAIANSDDISRIPKMVLREDSKAMFIPKEGEPWYCGVRNYMMHPEYEFTTFNTIALVELLLEEGERAPFRPICWPQYFYNTSNELYALGFTDDNKLLEKTIYKLQYVKHSLCNEFYSKAGLTDSMSIPSHILCGFAKNNKKDCEWENGMALASNSSGKWILIGVSLRGPGCAAPARFVDMFAYLPWVESATDLEEVSELDFRRRNKDALRSSSNTRRQEVPLHVRFDRYEAALREERPFVIERVDHDAIEIIRFNDTYEKSKGACSSYKNLVYRDKIQIVERTLKSTRASYRVSLYDMIMWEYNCVKIKINAPIKGEAQIWYRYVIDRDDQFAHQSGPQTPPQLLKYVPLYQRRPAPVEDAETTEPPIWKPGPHLEAQYITDRHKYNNIRNVNILVYFMFTSEAIMELEVFGMPYWLPPPPVTQKPTNTTRRQHVTHKSTSKNEPKNHTDKIVVKIIRRKSKPDKPSNRNRSNKFYRFYSRYKPNKTQSKSRYDSDKAKSRNGAKRAKFRRLHHRHNSALVPHTNQYRLQKALLRQAERVSMGSTT